MPEVNVEINGRKFRMACEDGQEEHLMKLAERFNKHVDGFKGVFGEIGDNRLTVMAGIAVLDDLVEAERRIGELNNTISALTAARDDAIGSVDDIKLGFAKRLNEVSRKIEAISTVIDETAQGREAARETGE